MTDVVGMVLCAGLGTRLRPLTLRVPKPAVPVCGVPLISWTLGLLAGAGVARAVVNVHHLPDAMAAAAEAGARTAGLPLAISREPVIAGTGGALREARRHLEGAGAIVVVNGDVLFDLDLGPALAAHRASGTLATMLLLPMPAGASYAAVEVDPSGAVRRIAGAFGPGPLPRPAPRGEGSPGTSGDRLSPWHFTGVHVLSPALLDRVPAAPFECDVNRHVYPPLLASGAVRGLVVDGYWNDLGTPARYLEASRDVLLGRVPLSRFERADPLGRSRAIAPGIRAGPGATVDLEATLVAPTFLGAGCRVPAGATVEDAVLWDGTSLASGERVVRAIAAGTDRISAG
ncbi:MAG TPA: sugar phosphate nucleotidyltransferase [Anaeromyxobacter sp.]